MRHEYTVEFRIFSETLDPAAITRELGLQPCRVRIHGTPRAGGKRAFTGMWAFNGTDDESAGKTEWTSLEEGLAYVLGKLWPLRETIAKYAADGELIWWCGNFQTSFDGGPRLSPGLLNRLGEFGATLYVDNYFSEPDEKSSLMGDSTV